MNDRFGIHLKNDESALNPINYPASNVYGLNKLLFSDILTKNKKKFPNLIGNNSENPDYLQISHLQESQIHNIGKEKNPERRRMFPVKESSQFLSRGKKCRSDLSNKESVDMMNELSKMKKNVFQQRSKKSYNIINHREVETDYNIPVHRNYFSKIGELNLQNDLRDKRFILGKLNENHRLNDGILDYLKEHGFA